MSACQPCRAPSLSAQNGKTRALLARGVVAQLRFGQLETDQQFEGRALHRGTHRRIGQRIERSIGIAGFALARDLLADFGGQRGIGAIDIGAGGAVCLRALLPAGELQRDIADALGDLPPLILISEPTSPY